VQAGIAPAGSSGRFAPLGEKGWWRRELIGEWLPPLAADNEQLRQLMGAMHWYDYGDSR